MAFPGPPGPPPSVSLSEKWEFLKPHIKHLYIDEDRPLSEVIVTMKRQFNFDFNESSYKYYINRKWKMKKNIPATKKSAMVDILQTRASTGKSTVMTYKGKQVDLKKLRRVMKESAREKITMHAAGAGIEGDATITPHAFFPAGNRMYEAVLELSRALLTKATSLRFLSWNMPYGAMRTSGGPVIGAPSPAAAAATAASTPSDVVAGTPSSGNAPSPHDAPSPMAVALRDQLAVDRAKLFVQGKHRELLNSMNRVERRHMSTWLYQFWLFSFRTAKNWGRGPRNWTADLLGFDSFQETASNVSPNTHGLTGTPNSVIHSPRNVVGHAVTRAYPSPSSLCRWAIHVSYPRYDSLPDPPAGATCDPYNESTWGAWEGCHQAPSFDETLRNGLESNDFSTLRAAELPVAVPQIAGAAKKSPEELLVEAFGFSVMSRNMDLVLELSEKLESQSGVDLGGFYPFHLATSYLDGSRTCCNVLDCLIPLALQGVSLRQSYTNDLGHTILDNLMIAILRSHTSCAPGIVDDVWQKEKRFAGEEVDICGRWDADSDCVRSLLAQGEVAIPFEWKHKFCHTSTQTICHCINTIFLPSYAPDINTLSGLFVKRCLQCGLKLQLTPLHTLVLTAFALARQGAAGEDLFGILACALCVLWNGADTSGTVQISLDALWHAEQADQCSHEELSAVALAERLETLFQDTWNKEIQTGWKILCFILHSSHKEWTPEKRRREGIFDENAMEIESDSEDDSEDYSLGIVFEDDCCEVGKGTCYFGRNEHLGVIYAAIQTELVTYRRLTEGDLWTSTNFNMGELLRSLQHGERPGIGLVGKNLMKEFCRCGTFYSDGGLCVSADQACASYFMNMDVWPRASFIDMPERNYA